ncbi:MAG: biotin--[acetyl-CoA-carboxylase] ligase [Polyangiaceae bacterium]|nr:biotin--[acetyl-CoA-carboxylase] ligase [Polyangiaceae bacterium]
MTDLEACRIETELDRLGATIGRRVVVTNVTASTNDDARQAAAKGAPHGAVFLAESQTRGRGRSGHSWHSPAGENLYLSAVLRPNIPPMALPPLTLVIGVCVARVVDEALGAEGRARIKWPNDVYVGEDKLAGILVETSLRGSAVDAVVVGIGINVHTTVFPDNLRATSLRLLGARVTDRSVLAALLLAEIGRAVTSYEARRLEPFHAEIERRDMLRGRLVEIGGVQGIAAGVDADGFLCVRAEDGTTHRFGSGSVDFRTFQASSPGARESS